MAARSALDRRRRLGFFCEEDKMNGQISDAVVPLIVVLFLLFAVGSRCSGSAPMDSCAPSIQMPVC
jgi:hypothetical protein